MKLKPHYLIIVGLTLTILCLGRVAWDKHQILKLHEQFNEELMEANLEIGKAKTRFGEVEKYSKDLEKGIKEEIARNKANINMIGKLKAELKRTKKIKGRKTRVVYREEKRIEVERDVIPGLLYQAIDNKTLVPIVNLEGQFTDHRLTVKTKLSSYPNDKNDVRFDFNYTLRLRISANIVQTITPTGAVNHYVELHEVDETGKKVGKFKTTSFDVTVVDQRSNRFYWWLPRTDVGMAVTGNLSGIRPGGSVGLSIFGYGATRDDLSWRILRPSVGAGESLIIGLSPFVYNIADLLPIFTNIWIGPHLTYTVDNNNPYRLGLFIGAML